MDNKIKFGVVGAGWMGTQLLEKVILNPDAELTGVFNPSPTNIADLKEKFSLADNFFLIHMKNY